MNTRSVHQGFDNFVCNDQQAALVYAIVLLRKTETERVFKFFQFVFCVQEIYFTRPL